MQEAHAEDDRAELLNFGQRIVAAGGNAEPAMPDRVLAPRLRSVLFVPANRREWIQKCHRYGADAIVLDLEDSVPPSELELARRIVSEEIGALSARVRSVWVRINASPQHLMADLEAAVRPGIAVIQLPKVSTPDAVTDLDRQLGYFEGRNGVAYRSTVICPILETAGGIRDAYNIAMSSPRLEYMGGIVAPEGDTALALGMQVMSDSVGTESLYIRSKIVVDARSAGVQHLIGGTVTDLNPDHELLRSFTNMNKTLGYSGMLLIHPSHVPVVNEIFSPSMHEIEHALEVLRLLRAAEGRGAVRNPQSGQMVDFAHARHAVSVLKEAADFGIAF